MGIRIVLLVLTLPVLAGCRCPGRWDCSSCTVMAGGGLGFASCNHCVDPQTWDLSRPDAVQIHRVPLTYSTTSAPDAENFTGDLLASSIPGITGTNVVKLKNSLVSAIRSAGYSFDVREQFARTCLASHGTGIFDRLG